MSLSTRIVHAYSMNQLVLCGLGFVRKLPPDHEAEPMSKFDEDDPEACEQCKRVIRALSTLDAKGGE